MIGGNKLAYFAERCEKKNAPVTAEIFLTEFCNLRCSYCRYANDTGKFMSFQNFMDYIDRLVALGVRGVILTGGGEPTMNPNFSNMTGYLENKGIPYGINTNLVKPAACNPNFLKVSIDAGSPTEYARIRGKDRLYQVLDNLDRFISFKKEKGFKTRIGVQCVALDKDSVIGFYNLVKGYDVDYIYIRPLESSGENRGMSQNEVEMAVREINDQRLNLSFKFGLMQYRPSACFGNWSVMTVGTNGEVPYCCHRPNDIVGHILDPDIMEKKRAYRVDMKSCETPCRLSGVNKFLEDDNCFESDYMFL